MRNRLLHSLIAAAAVLAASMFCSAAAPPKVWSLDPARLAEAKTRAAANDPAVTPALGRVRREADKALQAKPVSVMDKTKTPPSGDKHDYLSLGPYFWPDPAKSDGLPWINRDGEVNPASREGNDHDTLEKTCSQTYTLALGYYFTGHEPYAEKAAALLKVWFLDPATKMNPNLNFAQGIPGRMDGRGTGIIDTQVLIRVADSIGLFEGSRAWTPELRHGMEQWFGAFVQWLLTSKNGTDEAKSKNNHGTWYRAQVAAYALAAADTATARQQAEHGRALIASQIEPDGSQPLELKRTKSYSYSMFNLQAHFILAELGRRVGVDLFGYRTGDGRSLRAALDYVTPYFNGAKPWPGKQIKEVRQPDEELAGMLRRATLLFGDAKYEECLDKADHAALAPARFQLLWPRAK
jgi:Alginate lyase